MPHKATVLKQQIEQQLASRIPAALSPAVRQQAMRLRFADARLNEAMRGGVPVGAISEVYGRPCSGRTSLALSLASAVTAEANVVAWVDVADALDPETAALDGVDLERLLWVRCGGTRDEPQSGLPAKAKAAAQAGAHPPAGASDSPSLVAANHIVKPVGNGGCGSPHPRGEGKGMAEAINSLLQSQPRSAAIKQRRGRNGIGTPGAPNRDVITLADKPHVAAVPFPKASPYREEQVATDRQPSRRGVLQSSAGVADAERRSSSAWNGMRSPAVSKSNDSSDSHWLRLDHALRAVDLLLQAGGFSLVVLDLGSVPAGVAWRIPLATWFRFRAGCERSRASLLVLSQHPCARASADLTVAMEFCGLQAAGGTIATGSAFRMNIEQQRRGAELQSTSTVVPFRKPARSDINGSWVAASHWSLRA